MGYTICWYRPAVIDQAVYEQIQRDITRVLRRCEFEGIALAGPHGIGDPIITPDTIAFNGVREGEQWHEAFVFNRDESTEDKFDGDFRFCKTARKPYNLAVQCALIIINHYAPDVAVSSDGDLPQWADAQKLCQDMFGYGRDFTLS
jgi:hypothetical protein